MYGWRGRIGVIVPCVNTTTEFEFNTLAMAVPGISVHCARMHLEFGDTLTKEALLDMHNHSAGTAVTELAHAKVNVIVYACTSGSFVGGPEWDRGIIEKIEKQTGIPTITTSTSVVKALHYLNVSRIAVGAPYDESVTLLGVKFLEESGFIVVKHLALDNIESVVSGVSSDLAYKLGRRVNSKEADCVFISCTQFPTIDVIGSLELDLVKPVISANSASFWYALRSLSINSDLSTYGKLFSSDL